MVFIAVPATISGPELSISAMYLISSASLIFVIPPGKLDEIRFLTAESAVYGGY